MEITPPSHPQPTAEQLLEALAAVYSEREKQDDFADESPIYVELIPKLLARLTPAYVVEEPFAMGSTATVWLVYDPQLKQKRALKLARPRLSKLKDIIVVFRGERDRLAALNHQNITRIYGSDEVNLRIGIDDYSFPFFLMEFLEGVQDLDKYILSNLSSLSGESIITFFRDLLSGISFLHERSIVHCDIKPGNLLIAPEKPPLVADLGYAKHLPKPSNGSKETRVSYTPAYAHPDLKKKIIDTKDSAANLAQIRQKDLRPQFDLFAFGRSIQEILRAIYEQEKLDAEKGERRKSVFSTYQWMYLGYISKRLLDGVVEKRGNDELNSDVIGGLPDEVMGEIRYESADEAQEDFEKLLNLYDLEREIPELNANLASFVQIPHCQVPLTDRVQAVINHPRFARLAQVTQLGFVSLVYPGATHTRYEHVLGTFTHCCAYIRALWYDEANGLFQSIMKREHLELGLLAALIHDIGQYPMAHDLTEIYSNFEHERFTELAIEAIDDSSSESLADVIERHWGTNLKNLMGVLKANRDSDFRQRVLHSLISGPLDCDKLDYLKRDSTHLGVRFGLALDDERLLRNLTLAYQVSEKTQQIDNLQSLKRKVEIAETGVTEKARVVAQALWEVQKEMFTQVYWQHTTRALKAMLAFIVRNILIRLGQGEQKKIETQTMEFWRAFEEYVLDPINFVQTYEQNVTTLEDTDRSDLKEEESKSSISLGAEVLDRPLGTHLSPTDNSLLCFLWEFANQEERKMIRYLQTRKIYRRFAVLSASLMEPQFNTIYSFYKARRLNNELSQIEEERTTKETKIIKKVETELPNKTYLLAGRSIEEVMSSLRKVKPLILVDVPLKSISRVEDKKASLLYLPEDVVGVHSRKTRFFPEFRSHELETIPFDRDVGKIRVLAHPEWTDFLVQCLPEEMVLDLICN